MADDPIERLEKLANQEVPTPSPQFVERLESRLRIQHSELPAQRRGRRWWRAPAVLPRLAVAAALVIAGVLGVRAIVGDDAGVPIEVADGGIEVAPAATGDNGVIAPAASTPTPTPTAVSTATAEPTARVGATPQPDAVGATPGPVPTRAPEASPTKSAFLAAAGPTITPTAPPAVSPTTAPTAVPLRPATPVPQPTVIPTATPSPTPRVRPTLVPPPEPTPGLAPIELVCAARLVGDRVGVLCDWTAPTDVDVTSYTVLRNRNGADIEIVATIRATAPRTFGDRDVLPGDRVVYLVRASAGDRPIAASERQVVEVPTG